MPKSTTVSAFKPMNRAYNATFKPGRLSLGFVAPLEAFAVGSTPTLVRHIERIQLAETLGFAAVWLRDVPFNVPSFGDVGQIYDPFVYLGALAVSTERIALGVGSLILPLRHPAHVAKAAASADQLSGGRLLLGVASGDRPAEYPAMNMSYEDRGARFRDSIAYIRAAAQPYPNHASAQGVLDGAIDLLPKPTAGQLPLLITGGSRQAPDWVAAHSDGWITYPRDAGAQGRVIADYRARVAQAGQPDKPVMQSLYIDLMEDPDTAPRPIHLGFQSGTTFLVQYLQQIEALGVNHVALNLRFNSADIETTMQRIATDLLPHFSS